MNLCSEGHNPVCYEDRPYPSGDYNMCPVCEALEKIKQLEARITGLEIVVKTLRLGE